MYYSKIKSYNIYFRFLNPGALNPSPLEEGAGGEVSRGKS